MRDRATVCQGLYRVERPTANCSPKRGLPCRIQSICIRAGIEQQANHFRISIRGSDGKWRDTQSICKFRIGACTEQKFRSRSVIHKHNPVKCGRPVKSRSVDVRTRFEE